MTTNDPPPSESTVWTQRTVGQLVIRTIAIITVLVAIANIDTIFEAAERGRAAAPIVTLLLLLIAAVALWWFAGHLVNHMLKLQHDSGQPPADADPEGTIGEAVRQPGAVLNWHAIFLSLLGIWLVIEYGRTFLVMLFAGFANAAGSQVFVTLVMLAISIALVMIPRRLLLLLPMYRHLRPEPERAEPQATTSDRPSTDRAIAGAAVGTNPPGSTPAISERAS